MKLINKKKLQECAKLLEEAQDLARDSIQLEDVELNNQYDVYNEISNAIYALNDVIRESR